MPSAALVIIKDFTYRGVAGERWSNRYVLTGPTPANSTAWRALFDALVAQEKTLYPSSVRIVAGYGYASGDPTANSVYSVDLLQAPNSPVAGTSTATGNVPSGDQAAWIRWGLDKLNTKGKRVYLRKYFHGIRINATSTDQVSADWATPAAAFGTKMRDGTFLDGRVICDNDGTLTIGSGISTYITTRTLKRRGKRPPT